MERRRVPISKTHQPKPVTKKEGKSLQQSGGWFQRNKLIITWVLAIAFASTCIGFAGLMYIFNEQQTQQSGNQPQEQNGEKPEDDIKYWQGRVNEAPGDPGALANLGFAYQGAAYAIEFQGKGNTPAPEDKKKHDEYLSAAEENYKMALAGDPNYAFAITNLADIYLLKGKDIEAITKLENLVKSKAATTASPSPESVDTEMVPVYEKLCRAYVKTKQYEKAIETGNKALQLDPGNFEIYSYVAEGYDAKDDSRRALEYSENAKLVGREKTRYIKDLRELQSFLDIMGKIQALQKKIFDSHMEKGDYQMAIEDARKLLESEPDNYDMRILIAKANRGLKNYDEALKELDGINKLCDEMKKTGGEQAKAYTDKYLMEAQILQGEIYDEKKDHKKAGEAYRSARAIASALKDETKISDLDGRLKKLAPYLPKAPSPEVSAEKVEPSPLPVKTPAATPTP